jgi:hypothetical protein
MVWTIGLTTEAYRELKRLPRVLSRQHVEIVSIRPRTEKTYR